MLYGNYAVLALRITCLCGVIFWQKPVAKAQNGADVVAHKTVGVGKTFIAGRVFDARTKAPIAGAKVSWEFFDGEFETTPDAQGNYRVEGVTPAKTIDAAYAYVVRAKGYGLRSNYGGFEDRTVLVATEGLKFDFAMLRRASASGQTRDGADRPVVGAYVRVFSDKGNNSEVVKTGADGRWRMDELNVPFHQGTEKLEIQAFDKRYSQTDGATILRAAVRAKRPKLCWRAPLSAGA